MTEFLIAFACVLVFGALHLRGARRDAADHQRVRVISSRREARALRAANDGFPDDDRQFPTIETETAK